MLTYQNLNPNRLREVMEYNSETGIFRWRLRLSNRVQIGDFAGCLTPTGYISCNIDGKPYKAHRLAWLYVYGNLPSEQIDHINGCRSDNRIVNLRQANNAENQQNRLAQKNNTSGFLGVCPFPNNKWRAQIRVNGKNFHLGLYKTKDLAFEAYQYAKKNLHIFNPEIRNTP